MQAEPFDDGIRKPPSFVVHRGIIPLPFTSIFGP